MKLKLISVLIVASFLHLTVGIAVDANANANANALNGKIEEINATDSDAGGEMPEDEDLEVFTDDDFMYDGRIVGGYATTIGQYPYQVSLLYDNAHICGGSIVRQNVIITAAHCVDDPHNTAAYRVRAGSSHHKYGGQLMTVRRIIKHERYSTTTLNNDIAVVQLAGNLIYTPQVQPVRLASANDNMPGNVKMFVSGWGLTSEMGEEVTAVLRYVAVRLMDRQKCSQSYKGIADITNQMFCAGMPGGGKDSCQGDSGGPLVTRTRQGVSTLRGVVSFGVGCAAKGFPGVYAKVSALRPWINRKLAEIETR